MATMTAPRPSVGTGIAPRPTPDDVLRLEDRGLFELVDGQLVQKRMASESSWIAGRIIYYLTAHAIEKPTPARCCPNRRSNVSQPIQTNCDVQTSP